MKVTDGDQGFPEGRPLELPWWPKERGRPPTREPLSREEIVAAAIRLIDRDGLDALSMRRLGEELGASATTSYWHVGNKDSLLGFVSDAIYGEMLAELPAEAAATWQDDVLLVARAARRVLVERHPRAVRLFAGRNRLGPNTLGFMDRLLAALRPTGLDASRTLLAYRLILNAIYGYAANEAPDAEGTADGTAEASATRLASLPAAQFPNILAVVPAIGRVPTGEQYEYGIKRLLKGIEADVP